VFREFWIEKPRPDSTSLTVFALLDGPSATGASQFVIHPGIEVSTDVKCRLFIVGVMGLSSGRPQMQCLTEW
jgi:glucans biosynthesis protein